MEQSLLALALFFATTTTTPEQIAMRFFPAALTQDPAGTVPVAERHVVAQVVDLDQNGGKFIVAVYCNGRSGGAVSVLAPAGDGAVIATAMPDGMVCRSPELQLLDLDRDGKPEIIATMPQTRGLPPSWAFKWTGSDLVLLGSDGSDSTFVDPTFLLIDQDGTIGVLDRRTARVYDNDGDPEARVSDQYRLLNVADGAVHVLGIPDYVGTFLRKKPAR